MVQLYTSIYTKHTGKCKSTGASCNALVQIKLRTEVAEKVNKTCTSLHYNSLINVCVLFAMSLGAEKGGSVVGYDFISQFVIYFMG